MTADKKILVETVRPRVLRKLEALLAPAGLKLERATEGHSFQALAARHSFDLIFADLPLFGVRLVDFLTNLRKPESASSGARVVLLGRSAHRATTERLPPGPRKLVTMCTTLQESLRTVSAALDLSNRTTIRLLAETETTVDSVRTQRACQTENISPSGMLLRSSRTFPVGAVVPFSLHLPDHGDPILGRGEVVRHTGVDETVEGVGVRFLGLDGDGNARLRSFLQSR